MAMASSKGNYLYILVLLALSFCDFASAHKRSSESYSKPFPKGFLWGVGSSAYQIEGGWNASDKGESIWDRMTHKEPEKMPDLSNGDVTADSYHQWRRDVQMLRELHVKVYRFSISWPRILPTGYTNYISHSGLGYYSNLIDELLRYNITPMVTIYHWDLPQRLQELGGWTNPDIIPIFKDYAHLLFKHYGNRVKIWTTINEPWHICEHGYGVDYMAPAYAFGGIPAYLCGHNVLKAHAEVVHLYRGHFQHSQKGRIGITLDTSWMEPKTNSEADREASERAMQFYVGWFGHPIFTAHGNYPPDMIERIRQLSEKQNFTRSRLPEFTRDEIHRIRGTSDFFGINSYTSNLVTSNDDVRNVGKFPLPSFNHDMDVVETQDPNWPSSGSVWLKVFPKGMYKLLMWIHRNYPNYPIIITENGVSDRGGLRDQGRVDYLHGYLTAIADAIDDGADVQGYISWSLMDSFEWRAGYTEKFGLYHVDFTHPERKRTPKLSAHIYAQICKTNALNVDYMPNPNDLEVLAFAEARRSLSNGAQNSPRFDIYSIWSASILLIMQFIVIKIHSLY